MRLHLHVILFRYFSAQLIVSHPTLSGRLSILSTWKNVADLLEKGNRPPTKATFQLLENVLSQPASEFHCPLVEASLRFAEALMLECDDGSNDALPLLIRHFQITFAENLLVERGDILNARRVAEHLSFLPAPSSMTLWRIRSELCQSLVKAKLERAENNALLANSRLMCALKQTTLVCSFTHWCKLK